MNWQTWIFCGVFFIYIGFAGLVGAEEMTDTYKIARGGRLYDNWMTTLKVAKPPKESHSAYPKSGPKKGSDTWRCVACHGWDYQGTGRVVSKNLRLWLGKEVGEVVAVLRNPVHQYSVALLPDDAAWDLALFMTRGLIEPERYVDPVNQRSRGDAAKGAPIFQTICWVCHGQDGRKINFNTEVQPEYLGNEATDNPLEVLHKIRNGQPGQDMVNLGAFPLEVAVDVLAYAQTLPVR